MTEEKQVKASLEMGFGTRRGRRRLDAAWNSKEWDATGLKQRE